MSKKERQVLELARDVFKDGFDQGFNAAIGILLNSDKAYDKAVRSALAGLMNDHGDKIEALTNETAIES